MMYQQGCDFLILLLAFTSFSPCSATYRDDVPLALNHDHQSKQRFSSLLEMMTGTLWYISPANPPLASPKVVNVDDFGAKGDGRDDSEAFKQAWKEACSSTEAILLVPRHRTYHLKPMIFSGPCESSLKLKISGTVKASPILSDYEDRNHWLVFEKLKDFVLEGGGTINGNGRKWWKNSCKVNKSLPCEEAPTAVTFRGCNNLRVTNLRFKNAQKMHLSFQTCVVVKAINLKIVAPRSSPNTDGIHVTETQNVLIKNCAIRTGDDCISIVSGSQDVVATDITCGPGHGISLGSLGAGKSKAHVSNVVVNRAKLSGTTNGVRIKTWQGGTGYAKSIIFQNIAMKNVSNPIIIDQNYCDQKAPCRPQAEAVKVSNVLYKNIRGISGSKVAVKFDCSKSFPCEGILMENVSLMREDGEDAKASCENVELSYRGHVSPRCP